MRDRGEEVIRLGQVSARDDVTIATLWDISLDRIAAENPAAVCLLEICAYMASEPIPLDLFTGHASLLPEPLAVAASDVLKFNEAVTVCVDYSLARRSAAGLRMHRLVQTAVRARVQDRAEPLAAAVALLRKDAPKEVLSTPRAWPRWALLLPHVLAVTTRPEVAAHAEVPWLLDRAASYLRVHARLTEAQPLAERAVALAEAAHGSDHFNVAVYLNNLAAILKELGQPADARPLQERALTITETTYGPDHPRVALCLNNLAGILRDLGLPEEAEPLEERARAIWAANSRRSRIDREDGDHGGD